jgi:hypothetical protein
MTTETELAPRRGSRTARSEQSKAELEVAMNEAAAAFAETLGSQTERFIAAVNTDLKRSKMRGGNGAHGNGATGELAGPINFPAGLPPYPWWNLVMAGPLQPLGPGASGPFAPHKIIRAGEPAFMLGAIWRNPAPINWTPAGPSAEMMMAALTMSVQFQTFNLTTGVVGPTFTPATIPSPLGFGPVIPFGVSLSFPAPSDGQPQLYEINLVADVSGPVAGMPFAGYSTWHFDFDVEPPFLSLPAVPASLLHDIPARILVYTA